MTKVEAFAPAKINLTLHITGRREDGYHQLDSLVTFASVGDLITARSAPGLSLGTSGPFGGAVPMGCSNLVLRAAEMMLGEAGRLGITVQGAALQLEKNLPPASGIGGGSSDAAATCRALSSLWGVPVPGGHRLAAELGADVPVCMYPERPYRMRGIGAELTALEAFPTLNLLLVNPGVEVSTGDVFERLGQRENTAMPELPVRPSRWELVEWLTWQRNDLEEPAVDWHPEIGDVLNELRPLPGVMLARMSGSGATCFAIFEDNEARDRAAGMLREDWPGWWVRAG